MKIAKMFGHLALIAIFGLSLTSCGGYSERAAEKMEEKFDDGDMTKKDYEKCIEWAEAYFQDYNKLCEDAVKEAKNEKKWNKLVEEIEDKLDKDWEDFDTILKILMQSDEDEMGSANYKKWEKALEKAMEKNAKIQEKLSEKFETYSVKMPD